MKSWWRRRSRQGSGAELPEWATCFADARQLQRFERAVWAHFAGQGVTAEVHDGWVVLGNADMRYGLQNLAQNCLHGEEGEWPGMIAAHFEAVTQTDARAAAVEELLEDFEAVRDRLVVRLWELADIEQMGIQGVVEERIPGLLCVLMLDDDKAASTVPADKPAAWGLSPGELIELGIANVARMEAETRAQDLLAEEPARRLMLFEGATMYGGSMALRVDEVAGMVGREGALVSVPKRDTVFSVPIDDMSFVEDLGAIIKLTLHAENAGPGAVSQGLWWFRGGRWVPLRYEVKKKGLQFMPPPEFNEMMEGLVGEG